MCSTDAILPFALSISFRLIVSFGQVASDAAGRIVIADLFATFDMTRLPDAVNAPTLARLTRFIHDRLGYSDVEPTRYTVRELVTELCKFNTSGTLCWTMAGGTPGQHHAGSGAHGGTPGHDGTHGGTQTAVSRATTTGNAMNEMASAQRVFAHCAQPVVEQVETVLAEASRLPVLSPESTPRVATAVSRNDSTLTDWLERFQFKEFERVLDGVSTLLDVHYLVTEGELTAASLEADGFAKVTVRRFLREAQKVRSEGGDHDQDGHMHYGLANPVAS